MKRIPTLRVILRELRTTYMKLKKKAPHIVEIWISIDSLDFSV